VEGVAGGENCHRLGCSIVHGQGHYGFSLRGLISWLTGGAGEQVLFLRLGIMMNDTDENTAGAKATCEGAGGGGWGGTDGL